MSDQTSRELVLSLLAFVFGWFACRLRYGVHR